MVYRLDGVGSQKGAALLSLYNVPQYCNAGPRCPTPTSILLLPLRKQSHWCHCPAAQLLDRLHEIAVVYGPRFFPGASLAAAASGPPFLPSQTVLLVLLRYVARSLLVSGPFAGTLLHQAPLSSRLLDSQPERKSLAGRIPVQVLDMSRAAFFRIRCRRYRDGHNRHTATQSPCHV